MNKYPLLRISWYLVIVLQAVSIVAVLYSATWEFSTRNYLKGFSDAILPSSDTPEQKTEAILAWMAHGPARRSTADESGMALRNPEDTLNVQQLLAVCGTATNAFVNLAESGGLQARRLLLLDENEGTKHVVAEVLIDNRWIIVDPSYRTVLRLPDGSLVTRDELQSPFIFRAATQGIPNYPKTYTYERAAHIRMTRIQAIGIYLRRTLNFIPPSWETTINWTLLVERESFAMLIISCTFLCFAVVARVLLGLYFQCGLGIERVRFRDRLLRAGDLLLSNSK